MAGAGGLMKDSVESREPTRARPAVWFFYVTLAYFLVSLGSLWLAGQRTHVTHLWFVNPVGVVALLALPVRQWWRLLTLLALANGLAYGFLWGLFHEPTLSILGVATTDIPCNALEMLLAAALLRRIVDTSSALLGPERLARLLLRGALWPTLLSALAAAAILNQLDPQGFARIWANRFSGGLVGAVSTLPLALAIWLNGWAELRRQLARPQIQGLLILSMAVTLLAATTLKTPFVVMVLPLMLLAARSNVLVTAFATCLTGVLLGGLTESGVLLVPPTSGWWGDSLFYISVLATLLPGLFLATAVEGQAVVMGQLLNSEQRFRTLYTGTPAMMHSIDMQGRIVSVSRLWLSTMGYAEAEVLGRASTDFLTPESAVHASEVVLPQFKRDGHCEDIAYKFLTRDGQVIDVLLSAVLERGADGQPVRSLAVLQDVTEKRRLVARSHYAEHDPLTGLPNRVLMQDRLERSCARHIRQGGSFAVGFLDLDHFKEINDTLGHDAGDALLIEVAARLQSALRASDTVCRLGGDEFVLLISAVEDVSELMALGRKTLSQVAQPCRLGSGSDASVVNIEASMGLAIFPQHGQDPASLLLHADQAMYRAKRAGRNRCQVYEKID
jgi:diguanylate cyclase (GGDEF)-like protein/PAS domain S-box-containing protein